MTTAQLPKKKAKVLGVEMAFAEEGAGDPIVFLHGNPTSSYLWRNVMPHLKGQGRLIAPDLIGMGDSDKLQESGPGRYTFAEHRDHLFALLKELGVLENVTLVLHDWGSALGFHWAEQNAAAVKAIAYMEAVVRPFRWDEFPGTARDVFKGFRSPAGEKMILEQNMFIEGVLPGAIMRKLEPEEMAAYRKPFIEPGESRRPMLTWPRQIPIEASRRRWLNWSNPMAASWKVPRSLSSSSMPNPAPWCGVKCASIAAPGPISRRSPFGARTLSKRIRLTRLARRFRPGSRGFDGRRLIGDRLLPAPDRWCTRPGSFGQPLTFTTWRNR